MNHDRNHFASRGRLLGIVIAALLGLVAIPAAASAKDSNHDKIPDRWETKHGLSLNVNQAKRDQDRDQLVNIKEFRSGMDPRDADSDGDGVEDSDEGAGTVTSYDASTGELTITAFGAGSISGQVTADTEIKCDNGDDNGDEDGDGEGGTEPGDDHGGHGTEPGDDHGGGGGDLMRRSDDHESDESACSTGDLVAGAAVNEAELNSGTASATWKKIELLR